MAAQQHQQQTGPRDRHFTPWRTAATPAAQALVEAVRKQYLVHEPIVAPRHRARRPADQAIFDRQIEAIVADLVYEHLAHPERRISVTFSKTKLGNQGRYGSPILNRTFPAVVKVLSDEELGLVDRRDGSQFDWDGDGVKQTTIKADARLQTMIEEHRLSVSDFRLVPQGEVIILKREREDVFDRNAPIQYEDTEETNLYREQVHRLNRWLEESDICFDESCFDTFVDDRDRHMVRVFNNSSFDQGGRLFGGFWQWIPKEARKAGIVINAYAVPKPPPIPIQTLPVIPGETRHSFHSKPGQSFHSKVGHFVHQKPATRAGRYRRFEKIRPPTFPRAVACASIPPSTPSDATR